MVPTNSVDINLLKQEVTCIHQPSEATVSSDQVKTLMSTLTHFSLHYGYCMQKLIVAYLHTVEKQNTARAGGKVGKRSCWKAYIM